MFFWRKKNKNDKDVPPPADNDNPPPADQPPPNTAPEGKKPKRSLMQAFGDSVRGLRSLTMDDLRGTAVDTLQDLRKPKEVGILIVAIIVPGGMFGWGAYRLQKFKGQKPANDNLPAPDSRKPAPPQKKSGKNKPGKGGPKPG
ncbi:MAG: hypothetical protein Q8K65_04020 [Alphaproteobacteria bacterium]|nr:hypothetical protein [Alphaproteobacteria bacterium]